MRISEDGASVKLGFERQTKPIADYVAYMRALAVKPYLSAREASIFFDVGATRARLLFERDDLKSYVIKRGASPMMRRDVIERELLAEGAGDGDE